MSEGKVNIDERWKYLRMMRKRYRGASRKGKGRLLDEMEAVTGLERKTLVRLMNGRLERKRRRRERGATYGPEVDDALRVIHESLDYICAERLTPNLGWMARHLAAHGELEVTPALLEQLERPSPRTYRARPLSAVLRSPAQDDGYIGLTGQRGCLGDAFHPAL